ncbi:hypothetical protein EC900039_5706A, partial [Escherichia coli 90.0039]
MLRFKLKYI